MLLEALTVSPPGESGTLPEAGTSSSLDLESSYLEEVVVSKASYPLCTTFLSSQEGRQELFCDIRLVLKTCIFHSIMKVD